MQHLYHTYLSIEMIRPGDGSDRSIRLEGDVGPATSGDEVLVSAMLSPVKIHTKTFKTSVHLLCMYVYIFDLVVAQNVRW